MERNQNGYPILPEEGRGALENSHEKGDASGIDSLPLAYSYVPMQKFRMLYSPECALAHGTLFEELYLPMEVYGKWQSK